MNPWTRFIPIYIKLREFYSSPRMKKKLWDFKKAQKAEYNRCVDAILKMVNERIHKRGEGKKVVFAMGDQVKENSSSIV